MNVQNNDYHPAALGNQFKKRPLAKMVTLTLSLVGYGIVTNQANAANPVLNCDVNSDITINSGVDINDTCTITNTGTVSIRNEGSLANNSPAGNLINNGYLRVKTSGSNSEASLNNFGTITNFNKLTNYSAYSGDSKLSNSGTLTNFDTLYNSSYSGGLSTLTNTGKLNNESTLANESHYRGNSSLNNSYGAELINEGTFLNHTGGEDSNSSVNNAGSLINNGGLFNESHSGGSSSLINSGSLVNNGFIHNGDPYRSNSGPEAGTSTIENTGILINNYLIRNGLRNSSLSGGISTFNNSGTLINNGELNNVGGVFTQTAGSTELNGTIIGDGIVDIQGGNLSGSGSIEASQIIIGENATVRPGNSPGTLIMIGDVDLLGTLETEIESSSVYDVLEVLGDVTLADSSFFNFSFDGSYVETDGDSFVFLTAFNFDFGMGTDFLSWFDPNQFSVTSLDTGFDWSVSYTDNTGFQDSSFLSLNIFADNVVGDPNAVSTPGTLALFGVSLSLIGWGNRRRAKPRA